MQALALPASRINESTNRPGPAILRTENHDHAFSHSTLGPICRDFRPPGDSDPDCDPGFCRPGAKMVRKALSLCRHLRQGSRGETGNPGDDLGDGSRQCELLSAGPPGKVEIQMDVLESYKDFIRADSQVTIATALLGGKTVEISKGSPDLPPQPKGRFFPRRNPGS